MQVKECADEIPEQSETACSSIKNHFLTCSRPMLKLLDRCMPEESKGVPALIFRSIESATDFVCKSNGEHIFGIFFDSNFTNK